MKISHLTIFTNNLKEQTSFYSEVLGFQIITKTSNSVTLKTGESFLEFREKKQVNPYHFAFNIPKNKVEEVYKWLQNRVKLIADHTNKIIHFKKWNATAMYFYDKDQNIVEFIARANLDITSNKIFSSEEIISISEIGIPTNNIEPIYKQINNIKKIAIYDGSFDRFCAIGNEEGLFIIIKKEIKKWFPSMDTAYSEDFIIKGDYNFKYINGKIRVLSHTNSK